MADIESVSKDKEFEFVTSQITAHVDRSIAAFRSFTQVFSAIVGGAIWLGISAKVVPEKVTQFVWLSDILVTLVTVINGVMIIENLRSWHGYRRAQSSLVPHVPPPKLFPAPWVE